MLRGTVANIYGDSYATYSSLTFFFPQAQAEFRCSEGKMSFHYQHQSPGIFLNDDLKVVHIAYSGVMGEGWQTAKPCQAEVARYVLRMYDRGIVDPGKLQRITSLHFHSRLEALELA